MYHHIHCLPTCQESIIFSVTLSGNNLSRLLITLSTKGATSYHILILPLQRLITTFAVFFLAITYHIRCLLPVNNLSHSLSSSSQQRITLAVFLPTTYHTGCLLFLQQLITLTVFFLAVTSHLLSSYQKLISFTVFFFSTNLSHLLFSSCQHLVTFAFFLMVCVATSIFILMPDVVMADAAASIVMKTPLR